MTFKRNGEINPSNKELYSSHTRSGDAYFRSEERIRKCQTFDILEGIRYNQRQGNDISDLFFSAIHHAATLPQERAKQYLINLSSCVRRYTHPMKLGTIKHLLDFEDEELPLVLNATDCILKFLPSIKYVRDSLLTFDTKSNQSPSVFIRWGNGMSGIESAGYRLTKSPPTVNLFAPLHLQEEVEEQIEILHEETPFVWTNNNPQYSVFSKTLESRNRSVNNDA